MTKSTGSSGASNFEHKTHGELYGMVVDGNPERITSAGTGLRGAGKEIQKIAEELKTYIDKVRWEGEGADAFTKWGHHTVKESLKLAAYAKGAGDAMTRAGGALSHAQSMPKPNYVALDHGAVRPANPKKSLLAPTRVTDPHPITDGPHYEEAVREMERLASYYRTAQEDFKRHETPNFKPASGFVPGPPDRSIDWAEATPIVDRPAGSGAVHMAGDSGVASSPANSGGGRHMEITPSGSAGVQQDQHVGMSVDSTGPVTLPHTVPTHESTTLPRSSTPANWHVPPVPHFPTIPGKEKTPGTRRGNMERSSIPTTERPGTVQARPSNPAKDGIVRATTQQGGTGGGRPRLPGGTVMGEERAVTLPRPVGSGANPPVLGSGPSQGGTAGPGQRLAPHRSETVDRPRAAAMGEERGSAARGVAGGGIPGSVGAGGSPHVPGRRLASEPGGTVGSVPGGSVIGNERRPGIQGPMKGVGEPAAEGRTQMPRGRAGDFTSGGTGLTRGTPSSGALPMPGAPSSHQRRRNLVQRPDYLKEDGETWTAPHPSVVPPVIE
ncbi:hypothetical protein [Streptomyces sp. MST-110588]|uniref:WXG100 family type VII secretion target n=1 Tax=Streptomyces sp. MST-110588 TaxID=2833628 RepID=UPI001F5C289C|nr:hypothetical protein [Streptomyces sp. MST-110588]UNO41065.1 hypothetical protein KGS77_17575 [Streptomyces sp. MST-110588]